MEIQIVQSILRFFLHSLFFSLCQTNDSCYYWLSYLFLSFRSSLPFYIDFPLSFPALKNGSRTIKLETFTMTHLNACARAMVLVKVTELRCAFSSVLRSLLGLKGREIRESFSLFLVGHSGK